MNTETVLPILGELLTKSALILLAAALLVKAWRQATAAQRHLVWLTAVAAVLLLPATRSLSPRWSIPLHPAKKITIVLPAERPALMAPLEAAPLGTPVPVSAPVDAPLDWRRILLATWLGGAALLLGYRVFGSWRLHRLWRRSSAPDEPRLRLLLARTASELGLRRLPEVRVSAECRVPITWGTWRPVLLLPRHAPEWNDAWLAAALRHEAAHIVRRDALTRWLAQCACALYWPNPFVWLAARALRLAQEQAADDLVLRAGTPAGEYAAQLVEATRAVTRHGFFARQAVAMACPSTLEDRVRAIIDGRRDRRPLSRLAAGIGSIGVLLILALCTIAQLQGADPAALTDKEGAADAKESTVVISIKVLQALMQSDDKLAETASAGTFSEAEADKLVESLSRKKGMDLISAPTITARPGQAVTVEAMREFRYATDWTKGADAWEPKTYTTKMVGVSVEAVAEVKAGGKITLHVKPALTEFEGYRDLDAPGKFPATNLKGKRVMPAFAEGKLDTTVTLNSGETAAISGIERWLDGKSLGSDHPGDRLIILASARTLERNGPARGAAITSPAAPKDKTTARAKAMAIILPKVEASEASVTDLLEILRTQSAEFDPEKKGVAVILKPGDAGAPAPAPQDAKITLSLRDIPLYEAVRYVAGLANLQIVDTPDALVLQPVKPSTAAATPLKDDSVLTLTAADPGSVSDVPGNINISGPSEPLPPYVKQVGNWMMAVRLTSDGDRVDLTGETITTDADGVTDVGAGALLQWRGMSMSARGIRYNATTRQVDLTGKAQIRDGTTVVQGENLKVWLEKGRQIKISGPHKTMVVDPAASSPVPL